MVAVTRPIVDVSGVVVVGDGKVLIEKLICRKFVVFTVSSQRRAYNLILLPCLVVWWDFVGQYQTSVVSCFSVGG